MIILIILALIQISIQDEYYMKSLKAGKVTTLNQKQLNDILPQFKHVIVFPFQNEHKINFQDLADNIHDNYKEPVFVKVSQANQLEVYENQRQIIYENELNNFETIENFITDLLKRDLYKIVSQDDFKRFIDHKQKNKVLYLTENDKLEPLIDKLIMDDVFAMSGNYIVGICYDLSVIPFPENLQMDSIVLYKDSKDKDDDQDTGYAIYHDNLFNIEDIMNFLNLHSLRLINELNDQNMVRIFGAQIKKQILVFLDKNQDNQKIELLIKQLAIFNKYEEQEFQRILFSKVYFTQSNKDFYDYFGVSTDNLPQIYASETKDDELLKYQFQDDLKIENLKDFIENFRNKNLNLTKKSEYLEDQSQFEIKKMNYDNFQKEIINSKINAIVLFYTDFQDVRDLSIQAQKIYRFLWDKVKLVNYNVTFYTYDIVKNDIFDLDLKRIPDLRIYLKGDKKLPKIFQYEFTVQKVFEFYNVYFNENNVEFTNQEENEIQLSLMDENERQDYLKQNNQNFNQEKVILNEQTIEEYEAQINKDQDSQNEIQQQGEL